MEHTADTLTPIPSFTLTSPSQSWCLAANSGVLASKTKPHRGGRGNLAEPSRSDGKGGIVRNHQENMFANKGLTLHDPQFSIVRRLSTVEQTFVPLDSVHKISTPTPKIEARTVGKTWLTVRASKTVKPSDSQNTTRKVSGPSFSLSGLERVRESTFWK